jgi:plasmid stabilization system protein ParE
MDPYLEGSTWMNFHGQLCSEIARQLGPKLRPRYLARLTERFFTEITVATGTTKSSEFPDIAVVESRPPSRPNGAGSLGVAMVPVRVPTEIPESILHFSVEIRDRLERRLVTSIEVLSPTNKRGEGRDEYLAKRRRILHSRSHLVEIDLLRSGRRIPMMRALPSAPYYVYVGRFEIRPETDVWPMPFDQPLPTIPVPLLPGDADVFLDLQLALTSVYDLSDYNLEINYTQPPAGPLAPDQAAWVDERLRAAGLRP